MDDIKFLMGAEASLSTTSVTPGQVYFTRDTTNGISKIYLDIDANNRLNVVPTQIDSHAWGTPIKFKRVTYNYPVNLEVGEIAFNTVNKSLWLGNGSDAPSLLITPNYMLSGHSWDSTTDSTVGPKLTLEWASSIDSTLKESFHLNAIPAASETSSGIITTEEQIFSGNKTFVSDSYFLATIANDMGEITAALQIIPDTVSLVVASGFGVVVTEDFQPLGNIPFSGVAVEKNNTTSVLGILDLGILQAGTNTGSFTIATSNLQNGVSLKIDLSSSYVYTFQNHSKSVYSIASVVSGSVGSEFKPVYVDGNGNVQPITSYEGNAASASKLTNTTVIGSNTQPVYFTEEGVPAAVTAVDLSYGGTGSNLSAGAANAIITMGSSTGGAMVAKATSAGAVYASSTNGAITFGNLPLTYGGTGANLSTASTNSIIYKTTTGLAGKATSIGAAYVTSAGGTLTFGTLPIAQGGTGATSASAALTALGAAPISHASSNTTYGVGSTSNYGHVKITSGNGLSISSGTIAMSAASSSAAGAVTIGTQTFAGQKTFSGVLVTSSDLDANGRILLSTNCYGTSLPTSNNVEGRIFFLKM